MLDITMCITISIKLKAKQYKNKTKTKTTKIQIHINKRKRIILPSRKSYNSPILEYSMKVIPETRHSH